MAIVSMVMLAGCSTSKPYTLEPVKTFDPDNKDIDPPAETEEYFRWETLYLSTFYQAEKVLDLGNTFRGIGHALGINGSDEAVNVNVLDEVPESSWYRYRHYHNPMDLETLKRGPNVSGGPDTSRPMTIIRGKSEGVTPGFTITDATGNTFVIKVDPPKFPELQSSSEVIATLIYHAAGYYTPQNTIAYIAPKQLQISEKATITKGDERRQMVQADLDTILTKAHIRNDGKLRVLASKYLEGRPMGPWSFKGTREGDPNDRIPHEDRREVRGLRVLASWLNDTDRRSANTQAVYVNENGRRFVRHYLLDMGSTMGTSGTALRHTKNGQEYRFDPRYMGLLYATLGIYEKPWAQPEAQNRPFYPSVGYFESQLFMPGSWVTSYPNPAFEKLTLRDAFWGAKLVMSFSEEEIRAIVDEGQITNPEAREYLIQTLLARQAKIGRYWFSRINPLDKFEVYQKEDSLVLSFTDLGIEGNLYDSGKTSYQYRVSKQGQALETYRMTDKPSICLNHKTDKAEVNETVILKYDITTFREGKPSPNRKTTVYVALEKSGPRVVGIERDT